MSRTIPAHRRHRTRTDDDIVQHQAVDDPRPFERPPAFVELERGQLSIGDGGRCGPMATPDLELSPNRVHSRDCASLSG